MTVWVLVWLLLFVLLFDALAAGVSTCTIVADWLVFVYVKITLMAFAKSIDESSTTVSVDPDIANERGDCAALSTSISNLDVRGASVSFKFRSNVATIRSPCF